MSDNSTQYCYNCRFFKPTREGVGECLRYPPSLKNPDREPGKADYFPRVVVDDWCGDWMGTLKPDVTDPSGDVGEYGGGSSDLMEDDD